MKKLTFTAVLCMLLLILSLIGFIWKFNGGAADGANWVAFVPLAIAAIVAVLSKVLGGGWFTDNSGGH